MYCCFHVHILLILCVYVCTYVYIDGDMVGLICCNICVTHTLQVRGRGIGGREKGREEERGGEE